LKQTKPTWRYEESLWEKGFKLIAGVDEAGRGALAGPLIAAAVILPRGFCLDEVCDSKLLTSKTREKIYQIIIENALSYNLAAASPQEIDQVGIQKAHLSALKRAVEGLKPPPDFILCDYYRLPFRNSKSFKHGDRDCYTIACASILAKVRRDQLMLEYHREYPQYRFDEHKGYPTPQHLKAIRKYRPSPIHRLSYRGVGFWEEPLEGLDDFRETS
jgi:ribonuclease HII